MLKRIFAIAIGVLLGATLSMAVARMVGGRGLWPNSERERSGAYLREVIDLVNAHYVDPQEADYGPLTRSALRGMVSSLDPHSQFLEASAYRVLEEEMASEFGGVGVQIEMRNGRVVVIAPIAGTPGERAGILRGDEIVSVDGEQFDQVSMDHVIEKLRGRPRSSVRIGLFRPSTERNFEVSVVRERIRMESVREVSLLPGGVGYIQLAQFAEHTAEEFQGALKRLREQGMTSLVIDLRNNPGGLLDAAVAVAEPFFRRGELIVYTQGRRPDDRELYQAKTAQPPLALPIAVLINGGSASAAEILAGALKDTGRAVIVGERSFGKGSVQSIFRLRNGEGLRLTTARYYTPGGTTLHERGVDPHVEVVASPEDDDKLRLQRSRRDIADPQEFKERFGFDPIEDRQLQAALDVLKGVELYTQRTPANRG